MQHLIEGDSANATARLISALDSPLRVYLLALLNKREHFVHELVEQLGKSQPLVSQHLRVLKEAGIITAHRAGREVAYRLSRPEVMQILDSALNLSRDIEHEPK